MIARESAMVRSLDECFCWKKKKLNEDLSGYCDEAMRSVDTWRFPQILIRFGDFFVYLKITDTDRQSTKIMHKSIYRSV